MSYGQPIATQHPAHDQADRRWGEMKIDRARHEAEWEEITRQLGGAGGGFMMDSPAARMPDRPMSSVPVMAATNFAAGLYGTMTNPANRWFGFTTNDADANRHHPFQLWMETMTDRVAASFQPSTSPFYSASMQAFAAVTRIGNAAAYDELVVNEQKILDITLNLAEVCWDIDAYGRVCEIVRKFWLKPAQALARFGVKALPGKIDALAAKGDQTKLLFYHHVFKNSEYMQGYLGVRGKTWTSRHTCEIERSLVREAGYDEMPFYAVRWDLESGQQYARGLGFLALFSTRVFTRMEEATIRAAQRAADPTLLAPDRVDWPLNGQIRPGKVVYGGLNIQGNQMLRPLEISGAVGLTLQEKQAKIEEIKAAWHYILQGMVGRTGVSPIETMTINEEKQRLYAPHQGRIQEEYLARKIERRFSMLWRAGQLPPPPPGMGGLALQVTYQSAAAAAQLSVEGNATLRVLQDLAPLIPAMPRLIDRLDPDGTLEVLMAARGAPARMVRSREAADAIAQGRQQQEQMAAAMQMAQSGAGALKDVAGAAAQMQPQGQEQGAGR